MEAALLKYKMIYSLIIVFGVACITTLWIALPDIEKTHRRDVCGFSLTTMLYLASDILRTETVIAGASDVTSYLFVFISNTLFYVVIYFWVNAICDFFATTTIIKRDTWLGITAVTIAATRAISLWRHLLSKNADPLGSPAGAGRIILTVIFVA